MFEKALAGKLKDIFGFDKTTYWKPGDSMEQEGLFIEVLKADCRVKDAKESARVTGTLHVFAQNGKLPYGYFTKCIAEASVEDVKDLFFYDFEENKGSFGNISERSLGFLYLFDGQYDPAIGTLTEVNLSLTEDL